MIRVLTVRALCDRPLASPLVLAPHRIAAPVVGLCSPRKWKGNPKPVASKLELTSPLMTPEANTIVLWLSSLNLIDATLPSTSSCCCGSKNRTHRNCSLRFKTRPSVVMSLAETSRAHRASDSTTIAAQYPSPAELPAAGDDVIERTASVVCKRTGFQLQVRLGDGHGNIVLHRAKLQQSELLE